MVCFSRRIIKKLIPLVEQHGWHSNSLSQAAIEAQLPEAIVTGVFPDGPKDVLIQLNKIVDRILLRTLRKQQNMPGSITKQIEYALFYKLHLLLPTKNFVQKTCYFLASPQHLMLDWTLCYQSADVIWQALGVKESDWNYYSRRLTLAGLYKITVLYWLQDNSYHHADTKMFLSRNISRLSKIMSYRHQCSNKLDIMHRWLCSSLQKIPNP